MTNKFAFNPLSGQFDLVTASISPSDVTGGTANSVAGFDSTGALESVPGWAIDTTSGGLNELLTWQPNGLTQSTTLNTLNFNSDPLQNSPNETLVAQSIGMSIDVNNTGFNIGTAGQYGGTLALNVNHQGSSNIGSSYALSMNHNFGNGTDPFTMKGWAYSYGFGTTNANVTIDGQFQGYGFQPNIDLSANGTNNFSVNAFYDFANIAIPVHGYTSFSSGPAIASIANNSNYTGINLNPTVATFTGNAGFTGVAVGGNLTTLGTSGYQGVTVNPNINSMPASSGFTGVNVGGNITTLGSNGYQGVNINPQISNAAAGGSTGLNINMSGIAGSTNIKAIDAQEGQVSISNNNLKNGQPGLQVGSQINTATSGAFGGVFGNNQLGGSLQIASGFPISGDFGFGNNLGVSIDAQDNMAPDGSGLGLGFSMNGFVTAFGIATGKTFDTLNFMAAGASNGGVGSGTFTNVNMFRALGLVPGAGSAVITNQIGFKVDSFFSSLSPTNVWGFFCDDVNADNYLAKSLAIGTTTKKVTAGTTGLEIKTTDFVLDGGDQYITAMSAAGVVTNDAAGKLISVAPGTSGNVLTSTGTAWVSAAASGGTPAAPTSVKTANYTILSTDGTVLVDSSGGTFTVTFPASPVAGQVVKLKKVDASLIPVAMSGPATGSLNTDGEFRAYEYDGTNWLLTTWNSSTEYTNYTPTFAGFGTPSAVLVHYSRNGKMLRVTGVATTGTVGGSTIQIGLPGAITISSLLSLRTLVGTLTRDSTLSSYTSASVICIAGDNFVNVGGYIAGGVTAGLSPNTPQPGTSIFNNNEKESFYFEVPIFGWEP